MLDARSFLSFCSLTAITGITSVYASTSDTSLFQDKNSTHTWYNFNFLKNSNIEIDGSCQNFDRCETEKLTDCTGETDTNCAVVNLNIIKDGTGNGTITSNPSGIDCGNTCNANFNTDSVVNLIAIPATGSNFDGWRYACTGIEDTCNLIMNEDKNVTAVFNVTAPPAVITNPPNVVTQNMVRMGGTVADNGADTIVNFNFGPTTEYGENLDANPNIIAAKTGITDVTAIKTDLTCSTSYHYRVQAINSAGTTTGNDQSFSTVECLPDFVITEIKISPPRPLANRPFKTIITIENQSTSSGNGGYLNIWLNQPNARNCRDIGEKQQLVGELAAGETKTFIFEKLKTSSVGSKTFRAFIDSDCQTPEANETNNQLTK